MNRVHCPVSIITHNGHLIAAAALKYPKVAARLPLDYLTETTTILTKIPTDETTQHHAKGETSTLTAAQQASFNSLLRCMSQARKTARLAFPGQTVKLHQEFLVGTQATHDLASVLGRADIMLASVALAANQPALKLRGWTDADTATFTATRGTFPASTNIQPSGKSDGMKATGLKNSDAADAYDHILTIQNAADLEFPDTDPANTPTRTEFLLGIFPPTRHATPPPAPTGLTLTAAGTGKVTAAWTLLAEALKYGVWLKVGGVDPAYQQVATVTTLAYTLTNLPSGQTVSVQITGENSGGDGLPSGPVQIIVP